MRLRTEIAIERFERQIEYTERGLSVGSCFAENIARRLQRLKFPMVSNPFGVMYNPLSVADTIERLASGRQFTEDDLLRVDDLWSSFYAHGSFSSTDKQGLLLELNQSLAQGAEALKESDYIILTFGSAWIYELSPNYPLQGVRQGVSYEIDSGLEAENGKGRVVANCHKFPGEAFNRRRVSVEEIVERYSILFEEVLLDKHIIMTVSPVRHLKDGLAQNNISKSILRLAIAKLEEHYKKVSYFPSYEIMMDDLRDYRFYCADMLHPSEVALDYVWKLFRESAILDNAAELMAEVQSIVSATEHRPLNPQSESHRRFLSSMYRRTQELQRSNPEIDLSKELTYFNTLR